MFCPRASLSDLSLKPICYLGFLPDLKRDREFGPRESEGNSEHSYASQRKAAMGFTGHGRVLLELDPQFLIAGKIIVGKAE